MVSINAELTQEDLDAIVAAIATIEERMPFLVDLVADERKALPKLGDKTRAFVDKALEVADMNPDFLPRSFDVEQMRRSLKLFYALKRVSMRIVKLKDLVDDTAILAGSDAYKGGLTIYSNAKTNGIKSNGVAPLVEDMGVLFRKAKGEGPNDKE